MGEIEIRIVNLLGMFIALQGLAGPLLDHQAKTLQGLEEQSVALQQDLHRTLREISRSPLSVRYEWKKQLSDLSQNLTRLQRRIRSALRVLQGCSYTQQQEKFLLRRPNSCPDLTKLIKNEHLDHVFLPKFRSKNESLYFKDIPKNLLNFEDKLLELRRTYKNIYKEGSQNVESEFFTEVLNGNIEDDSDDDDLYYHFSPHGSSQQFPGISERISLLNYREQENERSRSTVLLGTSNNGSGVPATQGNIEDDSDDDDLYNNSSPHGSSQQSSRVRERILQFNIRQQSSRVRERILQFNIRQQENERSRSTVLLGTSNNGSGVPATQAEDQSHSSAPSIADQNRFLKQNVKVSIISAVCIISSRFFWN